MEGRWSPMSRLVNRIFRGFTPRLSWIFFSLFFYRYFFIVIFIVIHFFLDHTLLILFLKENSTNSNLFKMWLILFLRKSLMRSNCYLYTLSLTFLVTKGNLFCLGGVSLAGQVDPLDFDLIRAHWPKPKENLRRIE